LLTIALLSSPELCEGEAKGNFVRKSWLRHAKNVFCNKKFNAGIKIGIQQIPNSIETQFGQIVTDHEDNIIIDNNLPALCGYQKEETMPLDACAYFYECSNCHQTLKPE